MAIYDRDGNIFIDCFKTCDNMFSKTGIILLKRFEYLQEI